MDLEAPAISRNPAPSFRCVRTDQATHRGGGTPNILEDQKGFVNTFLTFRTNQERFRSSPGIIMVEPQVSGNAELAYRAYLIGHSGRIEAATPLQAENDEEAIEQTRRLVDAHVMELWDRGRLVVSLSPCGRC